MARNRSAANEADSTPRRALRRHGRRPSPSLSLHRLSTEELESRRIIAECRTAIAAKDVLVAQQNQQLTEKKDKLVEMQLRLNAALQAAFRKRTERDTADPSQLKIVPARLVVVRTGIPKLACRKHGACGVVEASRPVGLVEGNRYDTSIAAQIVTHKYSYPKTATSEGEGGGMGRPRAHPGDRSTPLTSRSLVRPCLRKCH